MTKHYLVTKSGNDKDLFWIKLTTKLKLTTKNAFTDIVHLNKARF